MIKYFTCFTLLFLVSNHLISMEKIKTLSLQDIDALSLTLSSEDYNEKIKRHPIEPTTVTHIIKLLLDEENTPERFDTYIKTLQDTAYDLYQKETKEILQEYYLKRQGIKPSTTDCVKIELCKHLEEEIRQRKNNNGPLKSQLENYEVPTYVGLWFASLFAFVNIFGTILNYLK